LAATTATAGREERRRRRGERRELNGGPGESQSRSSAPAGSLSEITAAAESLPERMRRISPGTTAVAGVAVGVLTGLLVGRATRKRGNEITGDVAVHLLNKIELLTIRLKARQGPRGGPPEIDVHHVEADATSS
jgi:hypothetical protein